MLESEVYRMNTTRDRPRSRTREKILEAALSAFLERGYEGATVREICRLAGVNVAAVHYHFQDKRGLYLAVVSGLFQRMQERYPPDGGVSPDAPAEARLRGFVFSFLAGILLGDGGPDLEKKSQLLARSLDAASPVLDRLIEMHIREHVGILKGLVVELLGTDAPEETLCVQSIIGQCMHYLHNRPVAQRLAPYVPRTRDDVERLTGHIVRFSLGGMHAVRGARV